VRAARVLLFARRVARRGAASRRAPRGREQTRGRRRIPQPERRANSLPRASRCSLERALHARGRVVRYEPKQRRR
jgi:hypothetical protein